MLALDRSATPRARDAGTSVASRLVLVVCDDPGLRLICSLKACLRGLVARASDAARRGLERFPPAGALRRREPTRPTPVVFLQPFDLVALVARLPDLIDRTPVVI